MENKYYTPSIEEFRIGFEYEVYIPEKELWSSETFYLNQSHIDIIKYVDIQTENTLRRVRVKYLDSSDIESFGFEYSHTPRKNVLLFKSNEYNLWFEMDFNFVRIRNTKEILPGNIQLFFGKIKNKSELQQVLKMIGVIE